jgi:prepilin-type N-terminal cleavage/methylation domain-containing protein
MLATRHSERAGECGFTLVEILMAMVLLLVGVLAVLGALISSSTLTLGSQVHEAAIGFAEQQIEILRQQSFASLGMTAAPSPSTDPNDPNFYTHSATASPPSCYEIQLNYQAGGSSIGCDSFVTGGTIPSTAQTITGYPGLTGTYDVYVTWHQESPPNNGCVTISSTQYCLSANAEKRITVAVLPTSRPGTGTRKPIWVTSIITDPNTPPLLLP